MTSARLSCAATLLALGVACQGCKESPLESAPVGVSARAEKPPPRTETPAPTPPLVELTTETPAPTPPLVELTPAALAKVKEIVASAEIAEPWALRLEASWPKAVCSPQHAMRFEANLPSTEDHAFESGGIKLVVLERQVDMLRGTEIHYGRKDGQEGFIINTPNFKGDLLEKWGPILSSDPLSATH